MTNFEKIKTMSVEEMAEALDNITNCSGCPAQGKICSKDYTGNYKHCADVIKKWLESEV